MKITQRFMLVCIFLTCQQYLAAQSYNLGWRKQSFAFETLYATHAQVPQVINNDKTANTQKAQKILTNENEQNVTQGHKQIVQLINNLAGQSTFKHTVCDAYMKIYQSYQKSQEMFLQLQRIQHVVVGYLRTNMTTCPELENQLNNASSMEEEIQIFLSYYKE
jgi:hypothetical protein